MLRNVYIDKVKKQMIFCEIEGMLSFEGILSIILGETERL